MDVIEAIRTRRAAKGFSAEPVRRETLLELVDAARYAPSGGNKNSWQFVLTMQRRILDNLAETQPHCRWFLSAQAAIAIVINPTSTRYWLEDSCVAAMTIWLAATGYGVAVGWGGMYQSDDREESERRQRYVRRQLSIPAQFNVPIVLGIGHHKGTLPRKRPALEEIVFWDSHTPK